MSASLMDKCLALLRYVKRGDYLMTKDINVPRECLFIARAWLEAIAKKYNLDPKYVYELDPYLQRLRYVKVGDILEPEDHNAIVDVLKKLREVLEKIEALVCDECCRECYSEGWNDGITWCKEHLLPLYSDLIIGADVILNVKPDEELASSATIGADVILNVKPDEELASSATIGADVILNNAVDIGSEVSIEPQA